MTAISPDTSVIFVEDDASLRIATRQALLLAGHSVADFADAEQALAALPADFAGVVVSDIRLPRTDGLQLLSRIRETDPDLPVILVTGHADVPMAVSALHAGAFDFLTKPFATGHLTASVQRALDARALVIENRRLRAALAVAEASETMLIGESAAMVSLRSQIRQVAAADIDVLVEGETGTGKELVALMLHRSGPRAGRAFVPVNCGALHEGLAEIELFGHAADSVASTRLSRTGLIAASGGGTILLDEIDSMPLAMQAKLLRVIEEREVHPIGADRPVALDLHVVATSKADLGGALSTGGFRPDLYYRLEAVKLRVPPLRDRGDDVLLLFAAFIEEAKVRLSRLDFAPSRDAYRRLTAHEWPGNVRELRNFAYALVLGDQFDDDPAAAALPARVAAYEAMLVRDALVRAGGSVQAAIIELGIPRKTFYDKIARHGIDLAEVRKARG